MKPSAPARVPSVVKEDFEPTDPLWELLGKAAPTKVSNRFAADVIRAIRHRDLPSPLSPWAGWLRWLIPTTATAAVALCLVMTGLQSPHVDPADLNAEFREAADLDSLVASSAGWAWHEVAP